MPASPLSARLGRRVRLVTLAALASSVVVPAICTAQDPNAPDDRNPLAHFNSEIVVTPERAATPRGLTPASTVAIDAPALLTTPTLQPAEILSLMPGFQVAQAPFHAGLPVVSARGFFGGGEADYVRLLVDGVPSADVDSGLIDWSLVSLTSLRRVEGLRGPGSSAYGDAAIGGVIQLFTDRAETAGQLDLSAGSFATLIADGSYGRREGALGFSVNGAVRRTDGAFEHSAGRQYSGGGGLDGRIGAVNWRWSAAGNDWNRDDPGWLSTAASDRRASNPLYRLDTVDRQGLSSAFTVQAPDTPWQPRARVHVSLRDEDAIRTVPLLPAVGDTQARALSTRGLDGSVESDHTIASARPLTLRLGADLAHERLSTSYRRVSAGGEIGALSAETDGDRDRVGLFASASWDVMPRLRLTAGTRWDGIDDSGFANASVPHEHAWSPRAGAVVRLTESGSMTAYVQAAKAFKAPTIDQRFDPRPYPDFRGGTFTISNGSLRSQRASNLEAGISRAAGDTRFSALVYTMAVEDEIDFDVRTFSYANIGRSHHTGVELEAERRWRRVRPAVAYTLTRVTEPSSDVQLKNVPRHRLSASAAVDLPWAIHLFGRCLHSWDGYLDDANEFPLDGPATCDLRVQRPLGRHQLFLDVLNVTDNVYDEYGLTLADGRGRAVPFAKPGAPRAVRGGVTLSF